MSDSLRGQVLGVAISMMILPMPFVALRLRARSLKGIRLAVEDVFLLGALLFNTASCITMIIGCTIGILGSHEQFNAEHLPIVSHGHIVSFQCQFALQLLAYIGDGLVKLSILLLYRRIFAHPTFKIFNTIWCAIIVAWTVGYFIATLAQCHPIDTVWLSPFAEATPGHCINIMAFYKSGAVTDLLTDILVLGLPIPMVWSLQLPTRKKLGVIAIFLLGGFVIAVGAIRIHVFNVTIGEIEKIPDFSYYNAKTFYWTTAETAVGIICACLPTFPPLFDSTIKGSLSSIFGSTAGRLSSRRGIFSSNKASTMSSSGMRSALDERNLSGSDSNSLHSSTTLRKDSDWELSSTKEGGIGVRRDFDVGEMYMKDYERSDEVV